MYTKTQVTREQISRRGFYSIQKCLLLLQPPLNFLQHIFPEIMPQPKAKLTNQNKLCDIFSPKLSFMLFCAMHTEFTKFYSRSFRPPSSQVSFHEVAACLFYGLFGLCYWQKSFLESPLRCCHSQKVHFLYEIIRKNCSNVALSNKERN